MSENVVRNKNRQQNITEKLYKDFERRALIRAEIENYKID